MQDLTPQFNTAQIKAMILKKAKRFEDAALSRLQQVFELALNYYRNSSTWTDQTGNLRSSGGYIILRNSEQLVSGGFEVIKEGAEGAETGQRIAEEIALQYPTGLIGIFVAGMDYAVYVEATGRDVLTGPSMIGKDALKKDIEELRAKSR